MGIFIGAIGGKTKNTLKMKYQIQFNDNQQMDTRPYRNGQCKSAGGCYNELVVANFRTGAGIKRQKR